MAKILLIDDEISLADAMRQLLTIDGHEVTMATNGDEGLNKYRENRPDLIITDILMPGKDGIEMVIEIRKSDVDIPIIAVSGGRRSLSTAFNLESSSIAGVNCTLAKPFTRAQLKAAVLACLG